jgi:hypothetical protein
VQNPALHGSGKLGGRAAGPLSAVRNVRLHRALNRFSVCQGCKAGEASIARLMYLLRQSPPENVFAHAKGSFALCVLDKNNRFLHCAVDPFGLMRKSDREVGDGG